MFGTLVFGFLLSKRDTASIALGGAFDRRNAQKEAKNNKKETENDKLFI